MSKPRSLTQYKKLNESVKKQIKLKYPYGFDRHLITFKDTGGKFIHALPFETETIYYLIKMTRKEAQKLFLLETKDEVFEDVVDMSQEDLEIEEIPATEVSKEVTQE